MTQEASAAGAEMPVGSLWRRLLLFLAFGAWFCLVYGLCDFVAAGFVDRHDLGTPLDDWLPYVPQLASVYLLINVLLVAPVLLVREWPWLAGFYATLALEVAIAGAIFLLFPVEPMPVQQAAATSAMWLADLVNLNYNVFPSLHVALALSCGIGLTGRLTALPRLVLWFTVIAVILSTVLTKQHYLADVVGGALLAVLGMRLALPRLVKRFS